MSLVAHIEKNVCVEKEQSGEELGVNVQIHSGWRVRGEERRVSGEGTEGENVSVNN